MEFKILAWKVKKVGSLRHIYALQNSSGKVVTETKNIISTLHKYVDLYKGKQISPSLIRSFLNLTLFNALTPEHKNFMDKQISAEEVADTI